MGSGAGCRHNNRKRLLRLFLTYRNLANSLSSKNTATVDAFAGMIISAAEVERLSPAQSSYSVRLRRCSSYSDGQCESLYRWGEHSTGSHAFFYPPTAKEENPAAQPHASSQKQSHQSLRTSLLKSSSDAISLKQQISKSKNSSTMNHSILSRILASLLLALTATAASASTSIAYDFFVDGIYYYINRDIHQIRSK